MTTFWIIVALCALMVAIEFGWAWRRDQRDGAK